MHVGLDFLMNASVVYVFVRACVHFFNFCVPSRANAN
jgi:hypothetical protein